MNARNLILCLVVALVSLGATSAYAGIPPMSSTETIVATVVPGQPLELFFPNFFDLDHHKDLTFTGIFQNLDPQQPSFGDFWFDWIDPTGMPATSPIVPIDLHPGETLTVGLPGAVRPPITFTIPFCPPQVSIHYQNNGPSTGVLIEGQFTHTCVPEPSSMLLAGLSLAGVGLVALRRRRS